MSVKLPMEGMSDNLQNNTQNKDEEKYMLNLSN